MSENRTYQSLAMVPLSRGPGFCRPAASPVDRVELDDPAERVMTDLDLVAAATIYPKATLDEAEQRMIASSVRMLLVNDAERCVVGVITATDILGEKPMQLVQRSGGRREELQVEDLMTPLGDLQVMRLSDVKRARVGDVVATLNKAGRQHTLVVDDTDDVEDIRGIFSSTQIARQLGRPVEIDGRAQSFAELEAALAESA